MVQTNQLLEYALQIELVQLTIFECLFKIYPNKVDFVCSVARFFNKKQKSVKTVVK